MKEYLNLTEQMIRDKYKRYGKGSKHEPTIQLELKLVDFINGEIDDIEFECETKGSAIHLRRMAIRFLEKYNELEGIVVCVRDKTVIVREDNGIQIKRTFKRRKPTEEFRSLLEELKNGNKGMIVYQCTNDFTRKRRMEIAYDVLGDEAIMFSRKNKITIMLKEK